MPLQPLSPSSSLLLNLKEPEGCKPAAQWPGNLTAFNCVDTKTGQAKTGLECETTTNPTWIHRWTGAGAETGNSTLRADVVTEIRQLLPFAAGDQASSEDAAALVLVATVTTPGIARDMISTGTLGVVGVTVYWIVEAVTVLKKFP
ncbi:hypothetical protein BC829DRAFT_444243 [Chytridium lagenaria]|nr:hypothetical protein BC829DRAFT_444243 [Chytridium lagenaria]